MDRAEGNDGLSDMLHRTTICVPGSDPGTAVHSGDGRFQEVIQEHYTVAENNALEKVVCLKAQLREASTYDFWSVLMEGMTSIAGAQFGFVTKRMLVDDTDSTVEMPPLGEPGSCLMGIAFYYNDGKEIVDLHRDYKYMAYGSPCNYMKHDKVFLIPNGMPRFITDNPNKFPFPADAYLGVPLFADGKCFGHFGMMWSFNGVQQLRLSWAYIELLMHSLEDVIRERMLEGRGYVKPTETRRPVKVIPAAAVSSSSQSLKPYARSLSHELRTPMQGVVGMLDVMYATVQESLESQKDAVVRSVLKTLRENIEVVQDSSRRAVEAADNVVHAYDLNMQVPDTPGPPQDDDSIEFTTVSTNLSHKRASGLVSGSKSELAQRGKRQRTGDAMEGLAGPAAKQRHLRSPRSSTKGSVSPQTKPSSAPLEIALGDSDRLTDDTDSVSARDFRGQKPTKSTIIQQELSPATMELEDPVATPGLRHTRIREMLHLIINESLRVGGRPESAIAEDTDLGETIEVRTRGSGGDLKTKIIEWSVDSRIPEVILVDERDLAKLVSCVFLNAVKFTEEGKITLKATLSAKARFVVIHVADTGPGIPEAFQPYLFRPFSREDDSLTRQKEGLGLGLLVAKGLARRIGGEITCVRSNVDGPLRGSEFELRVPLHTTDTSSSRAPTPSRTPSPGARSVTQASAHSPTMRRRDSVADSVPSPRNLTSFHISKTPEPPTSRPLSPPASIAPPILAPTSLRRPSTKQAPTYDRELASKYPLSFLVVEDNAINRKLLVNMLAKLGYTDIHQAHDGVEAVNQMSIDRAARGERPIDVILMDLWMPNMDGYEATEHILRSQRDRWEEERSAHYFPNDDGHCDTDGRTRRKVTVLAVTADVTDSALERASAVGMEGFMPKPYKLLDLERLILEYCVGGALIHI